MSGFELLEKLEPGSKDWSDKYSWFMRRLIYAVHEGDQWEVREVDFTHMQAKLLLLHAGVILPNGAVREIGFGQQTQNEKNAFPGPIYHETGGGGAVTTVFSMIEGELYIGMVEEQRWAYMGDKRVHQSCVRGYLEGDKDHHESAVIQLREQMKIVGEPIHLPGQRVNPNNALLATYGPAEGVDYFAIEVDQSELEVDSYGNFNFRDKEKRGEKVTGLSKSIFGTTFRPVDLVLDEIPCGLGEVGIHRTVRWLRQTGRLR